MRHWELPVIAALLVIVGTSVGATPFAAPAVALAATTPALVAVDVAEHRLPNRVVLPAYLACAAALISEAAAGRVPLVALASGLATAGLLAVLAFTGGLGMGDVKLGGVLGLTAGGLGVSTAVLAPLAGFLLGGIAAVVAMRTGRAGTRIPFGPYLLAGFWIAVLVKT